MVFGRFVKEVILLIFIFIAVCAGAGTSVGNFSHRFQKEYDFHLAHPADWLFKEIEDVEGSVIGWEVSNSPQVQNQSQISFVKTNFEIEETVAGAEDLEKWLRNKFPTEKWSSHSNTDFVGFKSEAHNEPDSAIRAYEYFLTARYQIVGIQYRKHGYKEGASLVEMILRTISRASKPPEISQITMNKPTGEIYKVGEQACYFIKMNDLQNSFKLEGLVTFETFGLNPWWSFKNIKWNKDEARYEVCLQVTMAFREKDLMLSALSIGNDRGQVISCTWFEDGKRPEGDEEDKACKKIASTLNPRVENSRVDRMGPVIHEVRKVDGSKLYIKISDEVGIQGGLLYMPNDSRVRIFKDQIKNGVVELDLGRHLFLGWNLIEKIIFYDENGFATQLEIPKQADQVNYILVDSNSTRIDSNFPVLSFFRSRKAQK
ncbi:MAG: hypothetical protein AB7O96_17245 [Pseudobdellovibrionaceae bacterium]